MPSIYTFVKRLSTISYNNSTSTSMCTIKEPKEEILQNDILSRLPNEMIMEVFTFLSFQDLIQVQLSCKGWRRLATDASVWKSRFQALNARITDIYAHNTAKLNDSQSLSWHRKYCQAITLANWRTGSVQQLKKIDECKSRLLSVKLKKDLLITLTEDNYVRLYQYSLDAGFKFQQKWFFGDTYISSNRVECIDLFPDMNLLVVAQKGSKCMLYDLHKPKNLPVQTLKGGSCLLFVPDSIAINKDYLVIAGRKPSVVFVWNWKKGIRLFTKPIDDETHQIFLSKNHLITINSNGFLDVFDLLSDSQNPMASHRINPCSIPCIEYNSSLSIISAPHRSKRINHYQWKPSLTYAPSTVNTASRKRFSLAHILGRDNKIHTSQLSKENIQVAQSIMPDFGESPELVNSIDTSPLCSTATKIVSVAIYQDRIATVNRQGHMALYALNGTTAAHVNTTSITADLHQEWVDHDEKYSREDDDLSDGYDFVRSRLAMGPMGVIYGAQNGLLWWLDFGCRADVFPTKSTSNSNSKFETINKVK